MNEYESNSHKSKEELETDLLPRQKADKIVTGGTKMKKKGALHEFLDDLFFNDVSKMKDDFLEDVLGPAIKKAIWDVATKGLNNVLGGGYDVSQKRSSNVSRVSYDKYYDDRYYDDRPKARRERSSGYEYNEIVFASRGDAEAVLAEMENIIRHQGVVSVATLYDLADIYTSNYTLNNWGWANLNGSRVVRTHDGYVLKLPKALPID